MNMRGICEIKSFICKITGIFLWKKTAILSWDWAVEGRSRASRQCGRIHLKVYPTSRWEAAQRGCKGWRDHSLVSSFWPLAALSAHPPLFVPAAECADPNGFFGTGRKEGANCSCDVGVVPFTAFAIATGQRPWKHAAPLSGLRPGGMRGRWKFRVAKYHLNPRKRASYGGYNMW